MSPRGEEKKKLRTSCSRPRYSPSVFSRTTAKSMSCSNSIPEDILGVCTCDTCANSCGGNHQQRSLQWGGERKKKHAPAAPTPSHLELFRQRAIEGVVAAKRGRQKGPCRDERITLASGSDGARREKGEDKGKKERGVRGKKEKGKSERKARKGDRAATKEGREKATREGAARRETDRERER